MWTRGIGAGLGAALSLCLVEDVWACGCVATTDVVTPTLQAGERILFAVKDGKVTAHVQIQYQGAAEDFAWLVPVPAVPEVRVGHDAVFAALEAETAPTFTVTRNPAFCGGEASGCSDQDQANAGTFGGDAGIHLPPPVVVRQATAGPYEYAVLRADDGAEMLGWLNRNGYVVPGGTDEAVAPYLRPGAFFLAVRLRAGESAGSIQPIVIEYASDFPMIPIVLTRVAAVNDMGILVWVLGRARAIPRNYHHVVVDPRGLAWSNPGPSYVQNLRASFDQAPDHHAFVTEFAGSSAPWQGRWRAPLGTLERPSLSSIDDRDRLLSVLRQKADWALVAPVLETFFPYPSALAARGVDRATYLDGLDRYVAETPPPETFDATPIVDALYERVVAPLTELDGLFSELFYLTRLYTELSPEEMTEDPVFAFNSQLPTVALNQSATLNATCEGTTETLVAGQTYTGDGRMVRAHIEVLREEGPPEIVQRGEVGAATLTPRGEGCSDARGPRGLTGSTTAVLLIFAAVWLGRRRPAGRT